MSVEFDHQLSAARDRLAGRTVVLSQPEANRLAALLLSEVLEDEDQRAERLTPREFRQEEEAAAIIDAGGGQYLARGDVDIMGSWPSY